MGLTHTGPAHRNRSCATSVRRQTYEIDLIYRTPRYGRFFMSELCDNEIEDAFAEIRANFTKRGNEVGLDILDSYEEQWAVSESLSDRQIAWLEKQLSWSRLITITCRPCGRTWSRWPNRGFAP